jgi:hypothetical protein
MTEQQKKQHGGQRAGAGAKRRFSPRKGQLFVIVDGANPPRLVTFVKGDESYLEFREGGNIITIRQPTADEVTLKDPK